MTDQPATATCPRCGASAPMVPIVFGYPAPETFAAADRGEIVLGGCVVMGEDPTHRCSACGEDVILDDGRASRWCVICGLPLSDDPDDDTTGDAGRPLCGACHRDRNPDPHGALAWLRT